VCNNRALHLNYKSAGGRLLCQFIAEGQSDPELLALYGEQFLSPRRQAVRQLWERGVAAIRRTSVRLEQVAR
jgi:hypothetical protein